MLADINCTEEALQEFRTLQDQIIKRFDSYIVLSIANIYYEWSTRLRSNEQRQGEFLKRANEKYMQVLEYDESNVFAAMGIAIILAEHNKIDEAYEILKSIMEACPTQIQTPSIMINLAHLNMVLENYEAAINLYRTAIEKFPKGHGDLECELYLSKAQFMNGNYDQCQKRLKSLAIRYPFD